MRKLLGLAIALLGLLGVPATSRAADVIDGAAGGVFRIPFTIANGATMQFETVGCGTPQEDTIMVLLEDLGGGSFKTAAINDDQGSGFTEPTCSYIFFTNTTGSSKNYILLTSTYPGLSAATVSITSWSSATGWVTNRNNVSVDGLNGHIFTNGTNRVRTAGLIPSVGGGGVDTVVFLINRTVGATSYFSDDEGFNFLSDTTRSMNCINAPYCWIVSGNFSAPSTLVSYKLLNSDSSTDSDSDGLRNDEESFLGTNSSLVDTDSDGITDSEEIFGVPSASLASGADGALVLPWQDTGSLPTVQDLFVEVDFMTAAGHDHNPTAAGNWTTIVADTTSMFLNDSAWTGRTIRSHIMLDQGFTESVRVGFVACGGGGYLNMYDRKNNSASFDPLRAGIFHYMIIGHQYRDTACNDQGYSGYSEVFGSDVLVTLGASPTVAQQRGTFMHELGHNLALVHNNNNSNAGSNSCVHSSPLNYRYQFGGTGVAGLGGVRIFSYSRGLCEATGCGNTCALNGGLRCVPGAQVSPKGTCSPNTGSCDCDNSEWAAVNLDFPNTNLNSFVECNLGSCAGASLLEYRRRKMRDYFLGRGSDRLELGGRRRDLLTRRGLVEGRDFQLDPATGRSYAVESQ